VLLFVKPEITYIQHFSCRFCNNYLSTLNGLKDVTCRRTSRDCVMRILNAAVPSNLGIIVCFNYLSPSLKTLSVKKPVHISELTCFISSLLNLLADLTYLQNGMYTVMDTQSVTVVVIPSKTGGKQYTTLYTKAWGKLI